MLGRASRLGIGGRGVTHWPSYVKYIVAMLAPAAELDVMT
jgi:hypothetical protein